MPVRKPNEQDFIRVHPGPNTAKRWPSSNFKDDRETFIVDLGAVPELQDECFFATLFTAINRAGVVFLWPVKVPADRRQA